MRNLNGTPTATEEGVLAFGSLPLWFIGGNAGTLELKVSDSENLVKNGFSLSNKATNVSTKLNTRFITTADNVVYDLQPTLDRIASGGKFPHRNDGTIFKNMEGFLPKQSTGYYKEFVHPMPGAKGPGAMRIVTGQGGEMWFTPDHYKTFIPIR